MGGREFLSRLVFPRETTLILELGFLIITEKV
jgi:hypothetical protein